MNIIITGASRGIGFELAKKFSADTASKVFAIARNKEKLEKLYKGIKSENAGTSIFIKDFDLNAGNIQQELLPFILEKVSSIDILINNAGLLVNKPFSELTDGDFDQTFSVNVKSAFRLTRDLLPYFSANAHIVNISSMGGVQGSSKFPGLSIYSASKGALGILTECLAEELKERKISVNALALGAVQTEMLAEAFPGYKAPLSAGQMADFIHNFALTGHAFFNGKILPVSSSTP